jgi:hypothetical protein
MDRILRIVYFPQGFLSLGYSGMVLPVRDLCCSPGTAGVRKGHSLPPGRPGIFSDFQIIMISPLRAQAGSSTVRDLLATMTRCTEVQDASRPMHRISTGAPIIIGFGKKEQKQFKYLDIFYYYKEIFKYGSGDGVGIPGVPARFVFHPALYHHIFFIEPAHSSVPVRNGRQFPGGP